MKRQFNPNLGPRPRCFEEGSTKLERLRYLESLGWVKGDRKKVWERETLRNALIECERKKEIWDRNEKLRQTAFCPKCGQHCGPSDLYHPMGHCLKTPD